MPDTRSIVIGLDGCSWNVLERLIETGDLPNIAALRDIGTSGVLESTIPFNTAPAWASFATAASPVAHGLYDFMVVGREDRLTPARRNDLRLMTYYELLGQEDKRSVIINLPLDQGGCEGATIVNSWLTGDDQRRILPMGKRQRYQRLLSGYRLFPTNPRDSNELCKLEEGRFDLARELFLSESWDHFFVSFSSTDWLAHEAIGSFLDGDEEAGDAFRRLYRQLDRYVGWFVDHLDGATIALISDHGQTEEVAVFRVNSVLHELGLVEFKSNGRPAQEADDLRATIKVPPAVSRLRFNDTVRPLAKAANRALQRSLRVKLATVRHEVDRAASAAFSPTDASFAIYVRDGSDASVKDIQERLLALELPDGRPVLDGIWTTTELYGRPSKADEPSLIFAPALGVRPSTAIKDRTIDRPPGKGRGCHQRDGIFVLAGSGVKPGDAGRVSIYDVAPTLLWTMDSAVPIDGDGRVLFELFDEDYAAGKELREVQSIRSDEELLPAASEESAELTRRLKALGYI